MDGSFSDALVYLVAALSSFAEEAAVSAPESDNDGGLGEDADLPPEDENIDEDDDIFNVRSLDLETGAINQYTDVFGGVMAPAPVQKSLLILWLSSLCCDCRQPRASTVRWPSCWISWMSLLTASMRVDKAVTPFSRAPMRGNVSSSVSVLLSTTARRSRTSIS